MAISDHRSETSLKNYIGRPSSEKIRACSDILSDMWVEGHISHCSRVLWRCHPERSSCSGKFGCLSFIKHMPWTLFCLSCEKTCVYLWATIRLKFTEHFTFRFCIFSLTLIDILVGSFAQLSRTANSHGQSKVNMEINAGETTTKNKLAQQPQAF